MKHRNYNFQINFLLFLLFSFPCLLTGQIPKIINFHKSQYGAGNQNWTITQSVDNKIYAANTLGMLEFDSEKWTLSPVSNYTDTRSLLYDEGSNRIYAGAFNEFGFFSKENNCNEYKYNSISKGLLSRENNFTNIWDIHKSGDSYFFQGEKEIFKTIKDSILRIELNYKIDYSTIIHGILFVAGIDNGISMLNGDIFMKLPGSTILNGKKIVGMMPHDETQILIVTADHGIYIFDGEAVNEFETDIDKFLKLNQVFCVASNDKYVAYGTVLNGVVIKEKATGINTYINKNSGLQDNTVLSLFFDNEYNLWLGLNRGISYIYINSPVSNIFSISDNFGSGYSSLLNNDILYLGTNQGLFYVEYPLENSMGIIKPRLFENMKGQVWFLSKADNSIFCGNDHGLYEITQGKASRINGPSGTLGLISLKNHPGYLLGCSYNGFFILQKHNNNYRFLHYLNNISETSGKIHEDKIGNIWFSHWQKGVFRFRISDDMKSALSLTNYDTTKGLYNITNIALSKLFNEIVVNTDGAFLKYDPASDRMIDNHYLNSIFGGHKSSVELVQSPDNSVWAISNDNIYFASSKDSTARSRNIVMLSNKINSSDTINIDSVSYKSILPSLIAGFTHLNFISDNKILVSTEDGFSEINISVKNSNSHNSKILFNNIIVLNTNDTISYSKVANSKNVVTLTNKQNALRFEFISPEYRDYKAIKYSYKLDGFDNEWSEYTTKSFKEYTNIPGGRYTFNIKCKNSIDSTASSASFNFIVEKPWYLTSIGLVVFLFILFVMIAFIIKLISIYSNKAAKRMEILKEKEIKQQEILFIAERKESEKQIIELRNQQLHLDLRHKSQELANSTMNLIRKNEILTDLNERLDKIVAEIKKKGDGNDKYVAFNDKLIRHINNIRNDIRQNIEHDNDLSKFEANFDIVYEDYIKSLSRLHPQLNNSDKRLCAFLKMDLSSKDIAPLLNMSVRSVEMARYRLRKKMDLEREINLVNYLQQL